MENRTKQLIEMHTKAQKRLDELEAEKSRLKAQWDWASGELIKRGYVLSASGAWMYAPSKSSLAKERAFTQSDEEFIRLLLVWKTLFVRSQAASKSAS
jgi:hypothetical protein